MKKIKIGLLARIVIAIILGIAIGTVFPAPLVRIFVTFNGIFSEFLNFSIPLIIVGLVTVAIADIGKRRRKNATRDSFDRLLRYSFFRLFSPTSQESQYFLRSSNRVHHLKK